MYKQRASKHTYQRILSQPLARTDPPSGAESIRYSSSIITGLITRIPGAVFVVQESFWHEHIGRLVLGLIVSDRPCVGEKHRAFGNDVVAINIVFRYDVGDATCNYRAPAEYLWDLLVRGAFVLWANRKWL
jgi:hypothetical protein